MDRRETNGKLMIGMVAVVYLASYRAIKLNSIIQLMKLMNDIHIFSN